MVRQQRRHSRLAPRCAPRRRRPRLADPPSGGRSVPSLRSALGQARIFGPAWPTLPRHGGFSLHAEGGRALVLGEHGQLLPAVSELARHAPRELFGGLHRVRHESSILKPEERSKTWGCTKRNSAAYSTPKNPRANGWPSNLSRPWPYFPSSENMHSFWVFPRSVLFLDRVGFGDVADKQPARP